MMIAGKLKLNASLVPREVIAVYLYGSAATGKMRKESDVDIAMLPSYKVSEEERLGLIAKLEGIIDALLRENGIHRPISVLDLRAKYLSVTLQYKVIREGVLLYERDRLERIDFENFVIGEYFDFLPFLQALRKRKYGNFRQEI